MDNIKLRVLMACLALVVMTALGAGRASLAQTGPGWTPLFDGRTLGDWTMIGETNWRVEDGAIVADKRTSQTGAFLLSKASYKDFALYVEFWASDDANSGIFLRCTPPASVTDRTCYEANIFDTRPDPSYGTGALVWHAEVSPMPKAGGKWNTMEITAQGRHIVIVLNGQKTVDIRNGLLVEGPFALQHGMGTIKFRKLAIRTM